MFKLGKLEVSSLGFNVVNNRRKYKLNVRNIETGLNENFEYTTQTLRYLPKDKNEIFKDGLYCLFSDYNIYQNCENEFDFIKEFGYSEEEGEKIYKLLEDNSIRFSKLLDDETMELLSKYYENY